MCKKEAIRGWKSRSTEKNGEDKWHNIEICKELQKESGSMQEKKRRRGSRRNYRGKSSARLG